MYSLLIVTTLRGGVVLVSWAFFLSFFLGFLRPNVITGLRPNVNTLTLLVRTTID